MNPNDLADAFGDVSTDTVIRRIVKADDGRRILVVGTIPDKGTATVSVRMDETEIIGSEATMCALCDAMGDVLLEMDDVAVGPPAPCVCGFKRPMVCEGRDLLGIKLYMVNCPECKRHTPHSVSKTDVIIGWRRMMMEEKEMKEEKE